MTNRREFIKNGIFLATAGSFLPNFLVRTALAEEKLSSNDRRFPILVVLQMTGGNDGLNTVIPYRDDRYYQLRPTLGVQRSSALSLTDDVGVHPAMAGMKDLYQAGNLAVIQNVGYPNPNRSHFRSMEIWHTAAPDHIERTGWIGRYNDKYLRSLKKPLAAVNIGQEQPLSLVGNGAAIPSIGSPAQYRLMEPSSDPMEPPAKSHSMVDFIEETAVNAYQSSLDLQKALKSYQSSVSYPQGPLGAGLKLVAQMIASDLGTRIYYLSFGSFDTHRNQDGQHANLLKSMSDALVAFSQDMKQMARWNDVLVMTFSEFGRRVAENGSRGTDHGTAAPMFVTGGKVRPGIYGGIPDLGDLDNGDLKYRIDFRSVYSTILRNWMQSDPRQILGQDFSTLQFI
ncbi:MAG TPA: DUF1501 domain-containing protein [Acidobacteriota bacterium]|jgi:uncharacterized protein (DUF1501 family)|nr:DUF1501 domain-containing protein [Acidobacteriota bacterium]